MDMLRSVGKQSGSRIRGVSHGEEKEGYGGGGKGCRK